MKRYLLCVSFLVFVLVGWGVSQEVTGTIAGTVTDSSGAVVAGAKVTVTNTGTNATRQLTTDNVGIFVAPLLPIGNYTVIAEAPGFKKASHVNIVLNVNEKLTHNFTLEVGPVSETVTVEAAAVQVELQSPVQAGLIDGTQIRELSLNNRNYMQLATLMPGVSTSFGDQIYIGTTNPFGNTNVVGFAVNGNRNSANNWTVDGADNVDRGSNLTLLNYPSVDAIAEVKVLRANYSAEFGRAAAGQINVVTRSGTSSFHGGAYEFFRNDKLSANSFFANRRVRGVACDAPGRAACEPPLRYNNFGYTIGGPVFIPGHYNADKTKTFFFWSQEWRRVRTPFTATATVPLTAEKAGNFTSPICLTSACTTTATSIAAINPVAQAYIAAVWAKIPGDARTLFVSAPAAYDHRQELVKIDHTFGSKLQVSGRYLHDTIPTIEPGGLFTGSALPGVSTTATDSPGKSIVIRATSMLSPTWLNEFGYSFSYGAIISRVLGAVDSDKTKIPVTLPFTPSLKRIPALTISGLSGVSGFGPYDDFNRNHNFYDNVSKIWGKHTFKMGFTLNHYQKTENAGGNNVGTFTFANTPRPTGTPLEQQSWANFLLGNAATFTQASLDLTPDIRAWGWEAYVQDDYRFSPTLTFNFGLRYSQFRQPWDEKNMLTNFDPTVWKASSAPQVDAVTGNLIPNTGDRQNGIIVNGGNSPYGRKVSNEDNVNFAPRIGFSWDPFGKGKTAVRSGYGLAYDVPLYGIFEQNIFTNLPFVQSINISNTRLENPSAGTPVVSSAPVTVRGTPSQFTQPYVQQWSLGVQHELMSNLVADVSYVGSRGVHLLGIVDLNLLPPGYAYATGVIPAGTAVTSANTPRLNAIRPFRGYAAVNQLQTWFNSNYHSMQVSIQKRWAGDNLFNVAYTWSKNMTDNQSDRSNAPQNPYNRRAEYSLASFDRRHVLTFNYVYNLPWFKAQQGFAGHVLGGWQLSGITTFNTGLPQTVTTTGVDPGGIGFLGASASGGRPDLVGDPNKGAPGTVEQWFNTSAFALVPAGQVRPGNAGRGTLLGPGYSRWDISVFKNFKVTEQVKLQFRTETFNIFNHTNFTTIGTTVGAATFGQVTAARDPRIIQLGLKLNF